MTDDELEIMVSRTGWGHLRDVTGDDWPDVGRRDWARQWVSDMAARPSWPPTLEYPPLAEQVGNAIKSAVKFAASGLKTLDEVGYQARLEICQGCELFSQADQRCVQCGCQTQLKLRMASESCPHPDGPKWGETAPVLEQGVEVYR